MTLEARHYNKEEGIATFWGITVFAAHTPAAAQVLDSWNTFLQYPRQTPPGACVANVAMLWHALG